MKKTEYFLILIFGIIACNKKANVKDSFNDTLPTDTVLVNTLWKSTIDYEDVKHDKFTEKLNVKSKLRWIITYYKVDTMPYLENEIYRVRQDSVLAYDPHKRSEEHTSELQSRENLVCRLLLEKKK